MKNIVVLISGSGTNLQVLIDHQTEGYNISLVLSNKQNIQGLERALKAKIKTKTLLISDFKKEFPKETLRENYDLKLAQEILSDSLKQQPDLIVLAGFMHILSSKFLDKFKCPIINLHPALPNEFDGIHSIERAFEAYKRGEIKRTGIMVHHVIPQVDRGSLILKKEIPIEETDTLEALEERIHQQEHKLILKAVLLLLGLPGPTPTA